jgi:CBS domain-containing protein
MSSRAAARLETLGFSEVYEYKPGKMDWWAAGLPMEGPMAEKLTALTAVRRNVPTAHFGERVGDVHARAHGAGWNVCLVVNEANVVLGHLRGDIWSMDPNVLVEDVMEEGPTTFRPNKSLDVLVQRMQKRQVGTVVITNPEGVFIGILYRSDAEELLKPKDGQNQSSSGNGKRS